MSKRVYITLNPNKEKDCVILEYLEATYNEAETIKSILYQIATNRGSKVNIAQDLVENISIKEVQKGDKSLNEEQICKHNKELKSNNVEVSDDIKKFFS